MPNEISNQLDTSEIAAGFDAFLSSQGLGDMNPSSAARYRQGVEASPMDDILAMNGFDLDSLFEKLLPEPQPLVSLNELKEEAGSIDSRSEVDAARSAIGSLGLSEIELQILGSLITNGVSTSVGQLPAPMLQLLQNPGVKSGADLVMQLGELYSLIDSRPLPDGKDLTELLLGWMALLGTSDSRVLLNYLRANPASVREALRDPLTGINSPLAYTSTLLRVNNPFINDLIVGSSSGDTLVSSLAGGTRLVGGGGSDLFVIPLSRKPFAASTLISDFDSSANSKVVIDATHINSQVGKGFKVANTQKAVKKLSRTKASLIYDRQGGELLFNANSKRQGFGNGIGGVIAAFENRATLLKGDLLVYRDGALFDLGGLPYL
jgi:hypothetical protein